MEWIPRNFLHCCKERYIIRFSSPYFSPKDIASNYVVWYTYPNKKQESVQVEMLTTDQLVVSESPKSDKPCAVSVAVQSKLNRKVVAYFTVELLSLADYLFKKVFFPYKAITPEVVDPHIVNRILAMFMAYYCNIGEGINDERQQTDGILQTLLSQLKDHKGNLASITTGPYGTQENIIHFVLRNKLDKTARYLIRNMRGYDHLFLEQDKNHKTPLDLAHGAGFGDLDSDIQQKINAKKPLVRTQSNTAYEAQYENPSFHTNRSKHLRKGIVKERYKHPGLLEILEVGDTVDVISGPDGGVYEVMIRDNHCFIPEVILWVNRAGDQIDASHTYEEIDNQSKGSSENFYMTVKSPMETPRVANHYIVEPVDPPSAAVSINERSPLAPPRSKDAKKPKSATLPTPKKSASVKKPLPYRPPPPKFASISAVPSSPDGTTAVSPPASISAPPRRKKSAADHHEEHVYEDPTVNQSTPVSSDTVKETEECYVEPADVSEKPSNEPADYLEICELPSAADGSNEPKTNENSTSSCSTANASKEAAVKSAAEGKDVANDEAVKSAAEGKDVANDEAMKSAAEGKDVANDEAVKSAAEGKDVANDEAVKSAAEGKDVAVKTNDENSPAHNLLNQKAREPADSTDHVKEKNQNLTILQAKKMFEAKPQSPSSNNKVMSRTSKVIKTGTSESAKTKATTKQKSEVIDSSNTPSVDKDLPKTPIQPEAESLAPAKQETSSNMADNKSEDNAVNKIKANDVQGSKNLIPAKPSKPAIANKPHIN